MPIGETVDSTTPQRRGSNSHRLPSLDGLRAISILMVIVGHLNGTRGLGAFSLGIGDYAHLGVLVFFVISGFLITTLLMKEHEASGTVSLKLFYSRRAIRIFPVAYSFLGVLLLLWWMGLIGLNARDLWHAATYTVNYQPGPSWEVGHLWSLSVEEQFYLLWPVAFVLLGPRRGLSFAMVVVLLAPLARVFNRFVLTGTPYHNLAMFPMVADTLAVGCILALSREWLERQSWYLRLFDWRVSFGMIVTVLTLNRLMDYTIVSVFGLCAVNVLLAVLIHRSVYKADDSVGRFLNWRPIAFVGVLSYSLYVWQQLFLNRNSTSWTSAFPQNLVLTCAVTLLSYLLMEKPLLRLRHRLRA